MASAGELSPLRRDENGGRPGRSRRRRAAGTSRASQSRGPDTTCDMHPCSSALARLEGKLDEVLAKVGVLLSPPPEHSASMQPYLMWVWFVPPLPPLARGGSAPPKPPTTPPPGGSSAPAEFYIGEDSASQCDNNPDQAEKDLGPSQPVAQRVLTQQLSDASTQVPMYEADAWSIADTEPCEPHELPLDPEEGTEPNGDAWLVHKSTRRRTSDGPRYDDLSVPTSAAESIPDDEELETVPEDEKIHDPLFMTKILKVIAGVAYSGTVEDVERGKHSGDVLYRVRYDDGDLEHFTAEMVLDCLRC
jgi:hypothetical protein